MSFGWSVGDIVKLCEVSARIYKAIYDAKQNSSKQYAALAEEFGRFHTFLLIIKGLLEKHDRPLPFGYVQFERTLQECEEFLEQYRPLASRRRSSFLKLFKTIKWTTEDEAIARLRAQVTGHAHTLGLYIGYLNLESNLDIRQIVHRMDSSLDYQENFRLAFERLENFERRLQNSGLLTHHQRPPPSRLLNVQQNNVLYLNAPPERRLLEAPPPPTFPQFITELVGFSQLLQAEQEVIRSTRRVDPSAEEASIAEDVLGAQQLETVRQEIDQILERVENRRTRTENLRIQGSDNMHTLSEESLAVFGGFEQRPIPTIEAGYDSETGSPVLRPRQLQRQTSHQRSPSHLSADGHTARSPSVESPGEPSIQRMSSVSTTDTIIIPTGYNTSPNISTAPGSVFSAITQAATPLTSPLESTPGHPSRPPEIQLEPAAVDWVLVVTDAEVTYASPNGTVRLLACDIYSLYRPDDNGLSLKSKSKATGKRVRHNLSPGPPSLPQAVHDFDDSSKVTITFPDHPGPPFSYTINGQEPQRRFQSLVYGQGLLYSRNINRITSQRGAECNTSGLRLFKNGGLLTLLFRTTAQDGDDIVWVQELNTAFKPLTARQLNNTSATELRLDFSDPHSGNASTSTGTTLFRRRSSGLSSPTTHRIRPPDRNLPWNVHGFRYFEVKFSTLADRKDFIDVWQQFA